MIGYGAIGRQFARLAAALGMRVIVWTMHPARYTGVEFVELDELYRTSDVVSVHLRLSAGNGELRRRGAIRADEARRDPDQHRPRRDRG